MDSINRARGLLRLTLLGLGLVFGWPALMAAADPEQATKAATAVRSGQGATQAQAKIVIEEAVLGMNVSGNKELPNMLYIIPWKETRSPLTEPSVTRLVDEIYATLDPEVFTRQSQFYAQLTQPEAGEKNKSAKIQE